MLNSNAKNEETIFIKHGRPRIYKSETEKKAAHNAAASIPI